MTCFENIVIIAAFVCTVVCAGFLIPYNLSYYDDCQTVRYLMSNYTWLTDFNFEAVLFERILLNAMVVHSIAKTSILPSEEKLNKRRKVMHIVIACLVIINCLISFITMIFRTQAKYTATRFRIYTWILAMTRLIF